MRGRATFVYAIASLLLLLVLVPVRVDSAVDDLRRILDSDRDLEDELRLLGPRSLIANHKSLTDVYKKDAVTAVNYTCGRDIAVLEQAIIRRETWALKMLDASSKIPSGLLEGNIIDLGMYDECIAANGRSLRVEIRGRHCMYSFGLTASGNTSSSVPLNPTLSICVPTSCTAEDIADLLNGTINAIGKLKNLGITISSASCAPVDKVIWDTEFTVCFTILVVFVGFLVVCSVIDAFQNGLEPGRYRHPAFRALGRFSLQRNAASILSIEEKEGNLPAIHGLRFLSIAWIVLGHEHVLQIFGVNVNNLNILDWVNSWSSLYIFIAPFAVDTFFTLSGFLMTYIFLKQIPKRKGFNVLTYYLHRFFRLTPAVVALVAISIVFVPKLGSGARWEMLMDLFANCRSKWWPNLLYVQNFVDQDNMCLGHLWYLAVDMQLFWISPLILYPLYKRPQIGLAILAAFFLISLAVPASIVGINKYPAISFTHEKNVVEVMDIFKNVYEMPYNRASPWLIGILLGYEVANNKNRRLSKLTIGLGWLLTAGAFAFCTFGTRSFLDPHYEYNAIWETFFTSVSRPIWAIGICWIIFASINNCAGPVKCILSWRLFQPLSRLSYCVYLVHIVIQNMQSAALRTPNYFSNYNIWHSYLSDLMISIVVAFFFSLFFESPILALEKMILGNRREPVQESQKQLIQNDEEDGRVDED